jgi:hypothetical protein
LVTALVNDTIAVVIKAVTNLKAIVRLTRLACTTVTTDFARLAVIVCGALRLWVLKLCLKRIGRLQVRMIPLL